MFCHDVLYDRVKRAAGLAGRVEKLDDRDGRILWAESFGEGGLNLPGRIEYDPTSAQLYLTMTTLGGGLPEGVRAGSHVALAALGLGEARWVLAPSSSRWFRRT